MTWCHVLNISSRSLSYRGPYHIETSPLICTANQSTSCYTIKISVSSLTQLLATESPLKMIKDSFYFMLKTLFVLKIFKFLS